MHYALQNWNKLISETLHPSSLRDPSHQVVSIEAFIKQSKDEYEKVKSLFIDGILERPKIKDKQQYVRVAQTMLVRLLDQLYSHKHSQDLNQEIIDMYDAISNDLENTLYFIQDLFGNYFDGNEKAPEAFLEKSIKELLKQTDLITQMAQSQAKPTFDLVNIIVTNFKTFCCDKKNDASYNELVYQKTLTDQLLKKEVLFSENMTEEILFYYNYNDDIYIAYLYEKLNTLTKSLNNKQEKIAALHFAQKSFNQLPTRLNCHLVSGMPSLKEQLNYWIEEEVKFLERDIEAPFLRKVMGSSEKEKVYVHVPFKGPEIYLVHKAFIDSGGAPAETYKSLFEKTASHLTNKNQRGFSTESLQKNSDKVDYEAKDNVKRFLQKMIRNIDSY